MRIGNRKEKESKKCHPGLDPGSIMAIRKHRMDAGSPAVAKAMAGRRYAVRHDKVIKRIGFVFLWALFLLPACSRLDGPAPIVMHGTEAPEGSGGYAVKPGDTVYKVAKVTGVDMHALIDINGLAPPYRIVAGDELELPKPATYTVQQDDNLYALAKAFNTTQSELASVNNLKAPTYAIDPGQELRIPSGYRANSRSIFAEPQETVAVASIDDTGASSGAVPGERQTLLPPKVQSQDLAPPKPASNQAVATQTPKTDDTNVAAKWAKQDAPQAEETKTALAKPQETKAKLPIQSRPEPRSQAKFGWPVQGSVLSSFGPKENGQHNDGINIGAPRGTPVRAAENGVVVYNGDELEGFGNLLLVRHSDGWMTAYAHLDKTMVDRGTKVSRGQTIGAVGSSGNVNTPQLHFEIRKGSRATDPKQYLDKI